MHHRNEHMLSHINMCWECRAECQATLFNHCLKAGGAHAEAEHVRLMMDCIEICQTAADFMTRNSGLHAEICRACAIVCDACADSCEAIGEKEMDHCADICRRCAESCRQMAGMMLGRQGSHTGDVSRA